MAFSIAPPSLTTFKQGVGMGGSTAVEGQVTADIEPQPLSSINEIFDWLQHGDVASRVVLDVARGESKSGPLKGSTADSVRSLPSFEMKCVDCHNRAAHAFELSERS